MSAKKIKGVKTYSFLIGYLHILILIILGTLLLVSNKKMEKFTMHTTLQCQVRMLVSREAVEACM